MCAVDIFLATMKIHLHMKHKYDRTMYMTTIANCEREQGKVRLGIKFD